MALTQEQLRDPAYAFEVGRDFAHIVGIDVNPLKTPETYAEAMHLANPRTPQNLIRYQLEGSTTEWTQEELDLINNTAGKLGILESEYPLDPSGEHDVLLVCGGARNAIPDRASFAMSAIERGVKTRKLLIAGAISRTLSPSEIQLVADWAPDAENELDLAHATVLGLRRGDNPKINPRNGEVKLSAFGIRTAEADHRDVVNEVILRELEDDMDDSKVGKLAVATTALYVPFKTHKTLAVAQRFNVEVEIAGVASRPEIVAKRTPGTYLAEIATTLASAAQHQAVINRLR